MNFTYEFTLRETKSEDGIFLRTKRRRKT